MSETPLRLRRYGDPCLRKKCAAVKEVGKNEKALIQTMLEIMRDNQGIGLAAPQVGINKQLFVADIGDGPIAVFNPKITKLRRGGSDIVEEGCLCVPGVGIKVRRPKKISVTYLDENNKKVECFCTELLARVFQHETDHLHGKLIVDYASWRERFRYRKQLKEIRRMAKKENQGT